MPVCSDAGCGCAQAVGIAPAPKNTSRADPFGSYVFHNTNDGVSLGVNYDTDGKVTAAMAVCSPRDNFSKKRAQQVLRGRLSRQRFLSKDKGRVSLTVPLGTYQGGKFQTEVFKPLMEFVRDKAYEYLIRGDDTHVRYNQRKFLQDMVNGLVRIRSIGQAH